MIRSKTRIAIELILISLSVVLTLLPACRTEREGPDRNRAPETFLTSAPPETTEADYRVHLYWHGTDKDGVVNRFIWFRSDTVRTLTPDQDPDAELLDWNPEARIDDYLRGRFTTKTDSILIFTGYDDGTGAWSNKQAFHIAAIDDGGLIDPTPRRLQFFARVKGIPKVKFWTEIYNKKLNEWKIKEFNKWEIDTIAMYNPFKIRFTGTTVNTGINGYQWTYEGKTYPDENGDGVAEWRIVPPDTVTTELKNRDDVTIPSGDFYFKVRARDEAGALSNSDLITGEGICQVVVNYDPQTWIYKAEIFRKGEADPCSTITREKFLDDKPDTFPYNSRIRFHYKGWDDARDSLQYVGDEKRPIRFQFMFMRWAEGGTRAKKTTPWYPITRAEDTNLGVDEDSTSMRVGTYETFFVVRSQDEQRRDDGTPDTVHFFGNFPPTIDGVQLGFWNPTLLKRIPPVYEFRPIETDTLYIGWYHGASGYDKQLDRGDTLYLDDYKYSAGKITKYFRFVIRAWGHDDLRDPRPGGGRLGVKGWYYTLKGEAGDYYYQRESEWIYDKPDTLVQEVVLKITVPIEHAIDDWILSNPPDYIGPQRFTVMCSDIADSEVFKEGIRAVSPVYDAETDSLISPGEWLVWDDRPATYAMKDSYSARPYFKLVW